MRFVPVKPLFIAIAHCEVETILIETAACHD